MRVLKKSNSSGFTIIELLIVMFIIGVVVVGLFGLFILSLRSSQEGERRVIAIALANEKMEMIRNLPYADVGTLGGVPTGSIPQKETVTRNGVSYVVRTDIRYIDDPFDGFTEGGSQAEEQITICHIPPGSPSSQQTLVVPASALDAHLAHGDSTGACGTSGDGTNPGDLYNTDYKQARIAVSWNGQYDAKPVLMISLIAPQGIEGGELGGTLDFQVLNSLGTGVQDADVSLINSSVTPAISISTKTNSEGRVILPGLPAGDKAYKLVVSKSNYNSEQTYDQLSDFIPDADHAHLSMLVQDITEKTFIVDRTAKVSISFKDKDDAPVAGLDYVFQGSKTIGVDNNDKAVYVVNNDDTTDATGTVVYDDLVWDSYSLVIDGANTGYDIKETNLLLPLILNPGDDLELIVSLVEHTDHSLHVTVVDENGDPKQEADVHLVGFGFDEQLMTSAPGQVFFADAPQTGEYDITISASGYELLSQKVTINGTTDLDFQLELSN